MPRIKNSRIVPYRPELQELAASRAARRKDAIASATEATTGEAGKAEGRRAKETLRRDVEFGNDD